MLVRGCGKGTVTVSAEAEGKAAGTIRVDVDRIPGRRLPAK